ncbi:MAG: exodeoxyribonuclease V subunit beta [Desulfuromonadales bacterium]|nr:exodeoxyribonuclease V subunit beta [Desulfuromonadales bacterium]
MSAIERFDLLTSALSGRNLLEASAGTGKTFTIAALYLRLLLETDLTVDQILVVTYTEAATEELRDRVRLRIRQALDALQQLESEDGFLSALLARLETPAERQQAERRLKAALVCFDEAVIHTIHGFCQRLLQDQAFETGSLFDTELITEQTRLINEIAQDYWRRHCDSLPAPFAAYLIEKKVTPASLVKILGQACSDPEMTVLPEPQMQRLEPLLAQWQDAVQQLSTIWRQERDAIRRLLIDADGLNKRSYPEDKRPIWLDETERFLADPAGAPPDALKEKLTAKALRKGTKNNQTTPEHRFFDACETFTALDDSLQAALASNLVALQAGFIAYARQELPERKRRENLRHFDDLLLDVRDRLRGVAGDALGTALRNRYRAAFIDEFQDTDPVQFEIFRSIYPDGARPVFFIGDPKQAIYSFRGADIFAYIEATRTVEKRYTLARNWRSTPQLVQAVNSLFAGHDRPFVFAEITFSPVDSKPPAADDVLSLHGKIDDAPLQIWSYQAAEAGKDDNKGVAKQRLATAVGTEIAELLALAERGAATIADRPLQAGDLAVLVRTHKEAKLVQQTLRDLGIPSVQSGTGSLFKTREAREVLRTLLALADPSDESAVKAALASDLFGRDGDALGALENDDRQLEVWLEKFLEYNRIWQEKSLIAMTGRLFSEQAVRARLLRLSDGQRRLTNLLHCFELLHQAAREQHLGSDGLLKWFARQFDEPDHEEYQIRLESDDNAVQIVTIHKSKGLEYPIVFCPFCWDRGDTSIRPPLLFHDPNHQRRRTMDLGSAALQEHGAHQQNEELAEQMRLLYVALTRARYRCYLGWGELKGAHLSALGYLLHARQQSAPEAAAGPAELPGKLTAVEITAGLDNIVAAAAGTIRANDLPDLAATPPSATAATAPLDLGLRRFSRHCDRSWSISSFTSLTAGHKQAHASDEGTELVNDEVSDAPETPEAPTEFARFLDFPRGARAGTCLHTLFESIDFGETDHARRDTTIRNTLLQYGFDPRWQPAVAQMVERTLATPLTPTAGETFCLAQLGTHDRLVEMEFHLPLQTIDPRGLVDPFAAHPGPPGQQDRFARRLRELDFSPRHGVLQGFADLVFRFAGRYYLLDWKSNLLGERQQDYAAAALCQAMQTSFYTLQYHLYLVALDRHLRQTLPDYRYDRDFGGVFYVYLRGTALNATPAQTFGIYTDRPDAGLIAALGERLCPAMEVA